MRLSQASSHPFIPWPYPSIPLYPPRDKGPLFLHPIAVSLYPSSLYPSIPLPQAFIPIPHPFIALSLYRFLLLHPYIASLLRIIPLSHPYIASLYRIPLLQAHLVLGGGHLGPMVL
jgi:hypothetical protein